VLVLVLMLMLVIERENGIRGQRSGG